MGSVSEVFCVLKRYPKKTLLVFASNNYDSAYKKWFEEMFGPRVYSDDCFEVDLEIVSKGIFDTMYAEQFLHTA